MAISYSLELSAPASARPVACDLLDIGRQMDHVGLFGENVGPDTIVEPGARTTNGMWVRAVDESPDEQESSREILGFAPTARAIFRYSKTDDFGAQRNFMVRFVVALLDRIPQADAVLHSEFDEVLLTRRDGELTANSADDVWPPEVLALLPPPYRRADLTFD